MSGDVSLERWGIPFFLLMLLKQLLASFLDPQGSFWGFFLNKQGPEHDFIECRRMFWKGNRNGAPSAYILWKAVGRKSTLSVYSFWRCVARRKQRWGSRCGLSGMAAILSSRWLVFVTSSDPMNWQSRRALLPSQMVVMASAFNLTFATWYLLEQTWSNKTLPDIYMQQST